MSSVVKGVANAVKSVVKGVTKVFKAVTKSSLGRTLLIGAAIYLSGGALGMWDTPFASINGALAGAGEAAAAGETAAGAAETGAEAMLGGDTAAAAETAGAAGSSAAAEGAVAGSADTASALSSAAADSGGVVAPVSEAPLMAGGATTPMDNAFPGLINNAAKDASWFSKLHPVAQYGVIQAGAGAVQNAFTPSPIDVERERARLERENLEWRQRFLAPNFNVGGINVGTPSGQVLRDQNGNPVYPAPPAPPPPGGIINTAMRR